MSNGPHQEPFGPFKATQIWNEIVAYVRRHVEVRCHVVKRVAYDDCFTGCDIVDVVLHHIQVEKDVFTKKPTREKACKICQVMVDFQLIECLSEASPLGREVFEDLPSKLYGFVTPAWNENNMDTSHMTGTNNNGVLACTAGVLRLKPVGYHAACGERRTKSISDSSPDSRVKPGRRVVQELSKLSQIWRRHNSSNVAPQRFPASLFYQRRNSLPDASMPLSNVASSDSAISLTDGDCSDVHEVTRETALYMLTQIIDLPILDGIITPQSMSSTQVSTPVTFVNTGALKRYKSICSVLSDDNDYSYGDDDDEWWSSALRCLECLKRGVVLFDAALSEHTERKQKLCLYARIADEYATRTQPLWSEKYADIHRELYRLLMEGREEDALRATQLSLALVEEGVRNEMRRLLTFLQCAACITSISLSNIDTNRIVVEKAFTRTFFRSTLLTPHQLGQLLLFLISHADKLWDLPEDVSDLIDIRLGVADDSLPSDKFNIEKTFCQRVSSDEFSKQKMLVTEQALVDMMNSVLDNTRMSLKEKTQLVENFKINHIDIWRKHFPNIA